MSNLDASREGLNILCIDGGGVRGLSALVLLEEIMKRIQLLKGLDSPPDPHECFDVIAGTGTGAVQACMLGRLRMPLHSAIDSYAKMAKDVFSEKKRVGTGSFKTTKLKESLRNIIQDATGDPEEPMMGPQTGRRCESLVFAMSSHNMRAGIPTIFRSYQVAANAGPDCTIWETLCATMAHPDLFKSFKIGGPLLNESFIDAGLGCNNPLAHVLAEVKTLYPERYVASVTSIGTGHTRTIQIPDTPILRNLLPIAVIVAMKGIAADTERVSEEMARRFSSTRDVYFRLSVDQGMQSVQMDGWEQLSEVLGHVRAYMKLVDVNQRLGEVARAIHSRKPMVPTAQIDGGIQVATNSSSVPPMVRHCPAPTPIFTGCELKLRKIESCVIGTIMERKVCVVQGLGGTGKTQAVLKVIERTYNQWKEVLYIDATTQGSIEGALKDIAIAKKVGDKYQDALIWLESYRERWLVVLDNADDPSLPLRHYIPGGNHGSIIITTRLSDVVSFARGKDSHCSVSSMDPDDALALLLKLVRRQDQELSHEEVESGKSLLQDLGHFALAIVHAGSFIGHSPHMSITKYRSLFTKQKQHALEAYSKLPPAAKVDGYTHTVYTAWFMCYETLRPQARELLWLTAFLHHTGITIDIFQRATMNILLNKPEFPTTDTEDSARQKLLECLCSFLDADQRWDELSFTESISEIVSRSLLEYDYTSQGYRIHVLVQDWVRTIVPWDADIALECAKVLLATSIPSDRNLESVRFRLSIGLHVDRVMSEISDSDEIGANHAFPFSLVYHDRGSWKRVEQLRLQIRETNERVLGSDHPQTLSSIHNLAYTYSELNRLEEAKTIYLEVLNARKRVLGDDHPDTLSNMSNLAVTYSQLGRLEEAIELQVKVLDSHKRLLGIENHGTLSVMHSLAVTYSKLGRLEEARILETQVLDLRKRVLGNDHPDTLSSMHNLSHTWSMLNQMEEARELQVQVLNSRKRVLGNDHPDTLLSMHGLACLYSELCRFEEARDMHSQVLDARKRALGIDHPDTLSSIRNLANTLSRLGQLREARDLMAQALDTHKRVLGNDHPKTLKNMSNLACVYFQLDQLDEARDLYVQVLDAHERVLGYDHPSTLITRDDLACTYLKLGLREDAEKLRVDTDKLVQRLGENCELTPAERDQPRKFQGRRAKRILPKIASAWSKLKGA